MRGYPTRPHGKFPNVKVCTVDGVDYKLINGMWILNNDPATYYANLPKYGGIPGYQREAIDASLACCTNFRTMIDGGAHIGLTALQFQQHFKRVHAFEPMPHNYVCLQENAWIHRMEGTTLAILPYALSDKNDIVCMNQRGLKSWAWWVQDDGEVKVTCRTIDTLELDDLDLIKLDIEGHELAALEGGRETILRCRPVILIEEKFDKERKASRWLTDIGMVKVWIEQYDILWVWPEQLPHIKRKPSQLKKGQGWIPVAELVLPPKMKIGAEGASNGNK